MTEGGNGQNIADEKDELTGEFRERHGGMEGSRVVMGCGDVAI